MNRSAIIFNNIYSQSPTPAIRADDSLDLSPTAGEGPQSLTPLSATSIARSFASAAIAPVSSRPAPRNTPAAKFLANRGFDVIQVSAIPAAPITPNGAWKTAA
jgi:hypothetical protein